jgi:hypothetical protein
MIDANQIFEMMLKQNINCITMFHNHLDTALKGRLAEIDQSTELNKGDKNFWKQEYEVNYPEKLRETSFLLMFGHLEEMLFLLWRDKNPNSVPLDRGYGITKFKPYIKDILGNLHGNIDYVHIVNAQKIRNSLLHIAGRVSLSKDSKILKKLANKSNFYSIKMDRVKIEYEGLRALQKATSNLTRELLNKSIQPTVNASAD